MHNLYVLGQKADYVRRHSGVPIFKRCCNVIAMLWQGDVLGSDSLKCMCRRRQAEHGWVPWMILRLPSRAANWSKDFRGRAVYADSSSTVHMGRWGLLSLDFTSENRCTEDCVLLHSPPGSFHWFQWSATSPCDTVSTNACHTVTHVGRYKSFHFQD